MKKLTASYRKDIETAINNTVDIEELYGKNILITGITGSVASFLVDMLLMLDETKDAGITIYGLARNESKAIKRFSYASSINIKYLIQDVCDGINLQDNVDYIIHAAGDGYPEAFRLRPVETMTPAIQGTINTLNLAKQKKVKSYIFISSGEVYGNSNVKIPDKIETNYYNSEGMSVRSCYPVAKQAAEILCVSYANEYEVPAKVVRLSHTYGPFVSEGDNRASTQFIKKAIAGDEIVLHSSGEQIRSYTYVADAAAAILTVLINGHNGEAYNVANSESKATILEFAKELSTLANVGYKQDFPSEEQYNERSPISSAILNSKKLEGLGFKASYTLKEGLRATLNALSE